MSLKMHNDSFGDRIKNYESKERFMPYLPVIARLDGKNFSKFTKGLTRPYDNRMINIMTETTKFLVDKSNAVIGYNQSDEITLIFHPDNVFFDGKMQKMVSVLASMATAKFNELKPIHLPEKKDMLAFFDCRVFVVPNETEAANSLLWRVQDAMKNSISMAAHHYLGHAATMNLNGNQKQEKLFQEAGVNFNDFSPKFKQGVFCRRVLNKIYIDDDAWNKIPDKHKPKDRNVFRHSIEEIEMPIFSKVVNRTGVIFNNEQPKVGD